MLTAAGVRAMLAGFDLRLFSATDHAREPYEVLLPDGTFTLDVPLDVAVEPVGTPGTFYVGADQPNGMRVTLCEPMTMNAGDSFTMSTAKLAEAFNRRVGGRVFD